MINNMVDIIKKIDDIEIGTAFKTIVEKIEKMEKQIRSLQEENERLKSEHYKDEEIKRLQAEIDAENSRYLSFVKIPIDVDERVKEWEKTHIEKYHSRMISVLNSKKVEGSSFVYEFFPTSISTCFTVKCTCSMCGNKDDVFTYWD